MASDLYPINDDLRAQLALEYKLNGWQVYRAREARWIAPVGDPAARVEVPAGWYWAAHFDPYEPLVVAATLAELETAVNAVKAGTTPARSIMREMLTADIARRLEVSPGHWILPGTPP